MKIDFKTEDIPFIPVHANIVFESEKELGMFYSIFSHVDIITAAEYAKEAVVIRSNIEESTNVEDYYEKYFERLKNRLEGV